MPRCSRILLHAARHRRRPDCCRQPALTLLDRDHSILAFNERVLDWAQRPEVPLIERLRYLCIVSSNLDEFFEVRAAPHLARARGRATTRATTRSSPSSALAEAAHALVAQQYALYNDELMPAFASQGIQIISHGERNPAQRKWVHEYFEREVRPLLIPVGLDPAHPFPQVANKSLNFIVRLGGKDAFGRENPIAIVKVPRVLPRVIRMPAKVSGGKTLFVALSSVVRAHLSSMFPGREVGEFSQFRVTRHSDLAVDEEDVQEPAHRAAPGAAASPLRPGRAAGGVGRVAPSRWRASCWRSSTCRRRRCTACTGRSTWRA